VILAAKFSGVLDKTAPAMNLAGNSVPLHPSSRFDQGVAGRRT
jgi:hypothetical protein